jgi:hypothetical protein
VQGNCVESSTPFEKRHPPRGTDRWVFDNTILSKTRSFTLRAVSGLVAGARGVLKLSDGHRADQYREIDIAPEFQDPTERKRTAPWAFLDTNPQRNLYLRIAR